MFLLVSNLQVRHHHHQSLIRFYSTFHLTPCSEAWNQSFCLLHWYDWQYYTFLQKPSTTRGEFFSAIFFIFYLVFHYFYLVSHYFYLVSHFFYISCYFVLFSISIFSLSHYFLCSTLLFLHSIFFNLLNHYFYLISHFYT